MARLRVIVRVRMKVRESISVRLRVRVRVKERAKIWVRVRVMDKRRVKGNLGFHVGYGENSVNTLHEKPRKGSTHW